MKRPLTATLIYNPLAGPADMGTTIGRVAEFWEERGWMVEIEPTQYAGHAVTLAREAAAAGQRLVLAAGGDGTLGEVANGLANSETILGPLPTGTGNSFGKELRMPRPSLIDHEALVEAAALLAGGRVQRMDLGYVEGGKYWLLWTGVGMDSYLVDQIEPRSKLSKRLGPAGYVAQAFWLMPRFAPLEATVTIDGRQFNGTFLLVVVSNCRRFAGGEVFLNPDAALDDGLFEISMFRGEGTAQAIQYLWEVWRGRHLENPAVTVVRGEAVTVDTARTMPVHTDGDPAGDTPLSCRIAPGALRLLVPRTAPRGLFQKAGLSLV